MKTLIILLVLASAVLAQVSLTNPASLKEQAPATFNAKFSTTAGDFTIQVTRAWSPNGADRFYNLVKNGFFTDASFFRVLRGFIAQFGMPADPKLNTIWQNATIKDDPKNQSNTQGTIVFATAGPNTRSCQFFINLGNNAAGLDPGMHPGNEGFTPFGKVVSGFDVVQKLYSGYGGAPTEGQGGHGPEQDAVARGGKAYLDKNFPKLDSIKSATIAP